MNRRLLTALIGGWYRIDRGNRCVDRHGGGPRGDPSSLPVINR